MKKYLVTGGLGFLGAALVKKLLTGGDVVRVFDNGSRGSINKLGTYAEDVEIIDGDIRDPHQVEKAVNGVDSVCHLAYINGTRFFYEKAPLVLEVGVKGMLNIIDGCMRAGVGDLIVASSSEVYQTPPSIPTDETVPLMVPDPLNPRYSYGGGKIISELLTLNYGREFFERVVIFRPHNVYGPDMGWEHVIPEFVLRMKSIVETEKGGTPAFPIKGNGDETRAFIHIDDFTSALQKVINRGQHMGIYHIGNQEETTIKQLVETIGNYFGRKVRIVAGKIAVGATTRRCPNNGKIRKLGYAPTISLEEGIRSTADWYVANASAYPYSPENLTRV